MRLYPPKAAKGRGVGSEILAGNVEEIDSAWFSAVHAAEPHMAVAPGICARGTEIQDRFSIPLQQLNNGRQQQHYDLAVPLPQDALRDPFASRQALAVPPLPFHLTFTPTFFSTPPVPPLSPSVSSAIANATRNQRSLQQVMPKIFFSVVHASQPVTCNLGE
jgi:hypothetical protein